MSTKPNRIPTWCSDAVNTIEIVAGHALSGYVNSEIPTSTEINQVFRVNGLWAKWLDDGDCAFAALSANSLTVQSLHWTTPIAVTLHVMHSSENATGAAPTVHAKSASGWQYAASANPVWYPVGFVAAGDTITGASIDLDKHTTGGATFTAELVYWDSTGEHTIASTASTEAGTGLVSLGFTHDVTVVAGRNYAVKLTPTGSVTGGADKTYDVAVSYRR